VANQVGELQPGKFSAIRDAVVQMIQKDPHAASGQREIE
jgi:hypothetical protein